jgi:26S proteasome non-ATPase regulatory subunit 10
MPNGWTPLFYAALFGHVDVAEVLLSKGADPNTKVEKDVTPLVVARARGHTDFVKYLLAHGAK